MSKGDRFLSVTMRDHNIAIEVKQLPRCRRAASDSFFQGSESAELVSGFGTLQCVDGNVDPSV